jgi:hypothetical protein
MTLSQKHTRDVCLVGSADRTKICRYAVNDDLDHNKWYCQKLQKATKDKIDIVVEAFNRRNQPISAIPTGDNCEGYPLLKHIAQGYDVI